MNNNIQEEFKNLISEVIQDEIKKYLKENNYYHLVTGKVVEKNDNRYSIDIGDTFINDIVNKSGITINVGDTVTLMEKADSNFSNCFILCKNGITENALDSEISKISKNVNDINSKIIELEKRGYITELNTTKDSITVSVGGKTGTIYSAED